MLRRGNVAAEDELPNASRNGLSHAPALQERPQTSGEQTRVVQTSLAGPVSPRLVCTAGIVSRDVNSSGELVRRSRRMERRRTTSRPWLYATEKTIPNYP